MAALCQAVNESITHGGRQPDICPVGIEIETEGQILLGTAPPTAASAYRAPEIPPGGGSLPSSIIYSAGLILYEIFTGKGPSGGDRIPLRSLRPDIAPDLSEAIMACLESDQEWRPKDLSYVLQVVSRLGAENKKPAAVVRPSPKPSVKPIAKPAAPASEDLRMRFDAVRKRGGGSGHTPVMAIVIGVIILAGAGVGLWLWMTSTPLTPVPATPVNTTPAPPLAKPSPVASSKPANPTPAPMATPTAAINATPTPFSQATPVPIATPALPVVTPTPFVRLTPPPLPVRTTPTPLPALTPVPVQVATPTPAPVVPDLPAVLTAIAPPQTVRGGPASLYDVHGKNLRADLRLVVLNKNREVASGFEVQKQRFASDSLIKALIRIDVAVQPGTYSVLLADGKGFSTNFLTLQVNK
ncbi:MAG: hypothetical protein MUF51_08280 [Vicinamibacteria bacterium]|nr:hypothetical protein [Vicinamibacteria bacterium]